MIWERVLVIGFWGFRVLGFGGSLWSGKVSPHNNT